MPVNRASFALLLVVTFVACNRQAAPKPADEAAADVASQAQPAEVAPLPEPEISKHKFGQIGVAEILVPGGRPPADGWPVVLAFHGDSGHREDLRDFLPLFADNGLAALAISAPIRDMGSDGYLWPPHTGYKLLMQYLSAAIEPFRDSEDLNFKQVFLFGTQEGGWYAMLLLGVSPELFSGSIALGPRPKAEELPNAAAPAERPLAIIVSADDVKGAFVTSHFEMLWRQGGSPFMRDVVPLGENSKQRWLISVLEQINWLKTNATYSDGQLIQKLAEYPSILPP